MASARRIKLIANPVAGRQARQRIEAACAILEGMGATVELFLTGARGDARRAAAAAGKEGFDRIVAAGGDGTLNEVINGLAPSAVPVAFIPLGTTNIFALEAGIPFDLPEACRIALEGVPRPVCLGEADGTRFLLMAGIGFDAEVVYGVSSRLKRWTGKAAYLASGLRTLLRRPSPLLEVVSEDGPVHRAFGAIISNGRLYGGRFTVTPQASLLKEAFEVCLFRRAGRLALLRCAARIAAGRPLADRDALIFRSREVTVAAEGVPVQIDGDHLGRTPMTFRAAFGEISLVFPKED